MVNSSALFTKRKCTVFWTKNVSLRASLINIVIHILVQNLELHTSSWVMVARENGRYITLTRLCNILRFSQL